jgi:molybdate transport system regulatory protein
LRIRLRVYVGEDIAIGPGKAQLLAEIARIGSILGAARALGMSYMRAWTLVRTMNRCFQKPLVRAARGGSRGGRAELTPLGREILALYADMTGKSLHAAAPSWRKLRSKLVSSRYT